VLAVALLIFIIVPASPQPPPPSLLFQTHTHRGARDVTTTRFDHVTTRYIMIIVLTTGKQSAVDVGSGRVGSGQVWSMKYSPTVANPPVCLFPPEQLTFDLNFCMCMGHDHTSRRLKVEVVRSALGSETQSNRHSVAFTIINQSINQSRNLLFKITQNTISIREWTLVSLPEKHTADAH